MQWESAIPAVHWNVPTLLCLILSEGLDLLPSDIAQGRPNTILALAIQQDTGPPSQSLLAAQRGHLGLVALLLRRSRRL